MIYEKAKAFIKSHHTFYYGYICAKNGLSKEGRESIIDKVTNPSCMKIEHLGDKNNGRIIYIIDPVNSYASGFFSNFDILLRQLFFAETFGFIPIVKCSRNTAYLENDTSFYNTDNYFDYFFTQPANVSLSDGLFSTAVIFSSENSRVGQFFNKLNAEQQEEEYIRLLQKYIHFNSVTQENLDMGVEQFLGRKRTLAVKYRGTDHHLNCKNHPIPCTPEQVATKAEDVFKKGYYDQVFLATEDIQALEIFKQIFGSDLIYDEGVCRYDASVSHVDFLQQPNRKNSAYQGGLDVLRDTWILAHAQGIVASRSGVTYYALRFNRAFAPKEYEEIHIIDNGTNVNGPDSIKYGQKKYGR